MRILFALASFTLAMAFCPSQFQTKPSSELSMSRISRDDFIKTVSVASIASIANVFIQEPAFARGRATLEQSYERYAPRVKAGGEFYSNELKNLIDKNDWSGIKNALQEPPKRQKSDLQKPDAGVAERARQAGQFSDARVLVAADLFASAFSDNSISGKTKKMQAAIADLREAVEGMRTTAKQALGEETGGGLFGLGGKKYSEAECAKNMRDYYVRGGNAWNQFVLAANEELPLQFDRFNYVK